MPNPFMRGRIDTTKNVDRPTAIEPAVEEYEGDNIPYRGVVDHGVSGSVDFRDTEEDMPDHDGRKVPVYEVPEDGPDPIPVRVVNSSSVERRAFRAVIAYAPGTAKGGAAMILSQDETRVRATIRNRSIGADLWISHTPEGARENFGYYLASNETYVTETQEAVYASIAGHADDHPVPIAIEYRRALDD